MNEKELIEKYVLEQIKYDLIATADLTALSELISKLLDTPSNKELLVSYLNLRLKDKLNKELKK